MASPTWLDFARLSAAVYDSKVDLVAGGWSRLWFGVIGDGFKGARYQRATGGRLDQVCVYAGTDPTVSDVIADIGFAQGTPLSSFFLSPVLAVLVAIGKSGLSGQLAFAVEQYKQAKWHVGRTGGEVYLTGHSLGGGLAQIVAADLGGVALPISAPTVSQIPGVAKRYAENKPRIVNLRVDNDPINATEILGARLGSTVILPTSRSAKTAHSIDLTVEDLGPSGCATTLGATSPV